MPKKIGFVLPQFSGDSVWISDTPFLPGVSRPLLIHFWAKSCPACKDNMPHLQTLRDRYSVQGLQVVAVHMPRGDFDLDVDDVQAVVAELGITEPCVVDNDHTIGEEFEVNAWPTYYLFAANGLLKRHAAGGFGVRMMENALSDMFPVGERQP